MAEHLLELDDISKYYGSINALRGVSTFVNAGEVTCVLGDNGAGKSTFIKILAGVHQQSEGKIRMNGEEVMFDSPRDALAAGIATVYQDLAMVPLMSVWRNFFLGSEPTNNLGPLKWIDKAKAKRIAKEEMAKMGIDIRDTEQPVGTLSGGERQSVAIARAGYFGAKVLILDEPTSGLDPIGRKELRDLMAELKREGRSILVSSHVLSDIESLCDSVVILHKGQVRARGTLHDLLRRDRMETEVSVLLPEGDAGATARAALLAIEGADLVRDDDARRLRLVVPASAVGADRRRRARKTRMWQTRHSGRRMEFSAQGNAFRQPMARFSVQAQRRYRL